MEKSNEWMLRKGLKAPSSNSNLLLMTIKMNNSIHKEIIEIPNQRCSRKWWVLSSVTKWPSRNLIDWDLSLIERIGCVVDLLPKISSNRWPRGLVCQSPVLIRGICLASSNSPFHSSTKGVILEQSRWINL